MLAQMECQPWEHHDYLVVMFANSQDWQSCGELLGIRKVEIQYPGGRSKVGIGRAISGARLLKMLNQAKDEAMLKIRLGEIMGAIENAKQAAIAAGDTKAENQLDEVKDRISQVISGSPALAEREFPAPPLK